MTPHPPEDARDDALADAWFEYDGAVMDCLEALRRCAPDDALIAACKRRDTLRDALVAAVSARVQAECADTKRLDWLQKQAHYKHADWGYCAAQRSWCVRSTGRDSQDHSGIVDDVRVAIDAAMEAK